MDRTLPPTSGPTRTPSHNVGREVLGRGARRRPDLRLATPIAAPWPVQQAAVLAAALRVCLRRHGSGHPHAGPGAEYAAVIEDRLGNTSPEWWPSWLDRLADATAEEVQAFSTSPDSVVHELWSITEAHEWTVDALFYVLGAVLPVRAPQINSHPDPECAGIRPPLRALATDPVVQLVASMTVLRWIAEARTRDLFAPSASWVEALAAVIDYSGVEA